MKTALQAAIPTTIILAALALSACSLDVRNTIAPDGSGELIVEIGPEAGELDQLAALNLTLEQACNPAISASLSLPPQTVYRLESPGEAPRCILSIPFVDLESLRGVLTSSLSSITVNVLSLSDERFIYDISMDLTRRPEIQELALPQTRVTWQLTPPGQLAGHNADRVDGDTLIWEVGPGEFRTLRAESTFGGGIPEGGLRGLALRVFGYACLCGLGFAAFAGGAWYFVRRRKPAPATQA